MSNMKKTVSVFSFMLAIACHLACHAAPLSDTADEEDRRNPLNFQPYVTDFSGSEYAPSDFIDFHLDGSEFQAMKDAANRRIIPDSKMRADRLDLFIIEHDQDENAEPDADMAKLQPVQNRLLDWVPDKVDRLDNGGFVTAPDNGRPVPYRLNGHVGIERGYPWAADN